MPRLIELTLNGAQPTVVDVGVVLRDQVNADVLRLPTWPFVPEPDPLKLRLVDWLCLQVTLDQPLEEPATVGVGSCEIAVRNQHVVKCASILDRRLGAPAARRVHVLGVHLQLRVERYVEISWSVRHKGGVVAWRCLLRFVTKRVTSYH